MVARRGSRSRSITRSLSTVTRASTRFAPTAPACARFIRPPAHLKALGTHTPIPTGSRWNRQLLPRPARLPRRVHRDPPQRDGPGEQVVQARQLDGHGPRRCLQGTPPSRPDNTEIGRERAEGHRVPDSPHPPRIDPGRRADGLQGDRVGRCVRHGIRRGRRITAGETATAVRLSIRGDTIAGDLTVTKNRGPASKLVEFNAGTGTLDCKRNEAPFSPPPATRAGNGKRAMQDGP